MAAKTVYTRWFLLVVTISSMVWQSLRMTISQPRLSKKINPYKYILSCCVRASGTGPVWYDSDHDRGATSVVKFTKSRDIKASINILKSSCEMCSLSTRLPHFNISKSNCRWSECPKALTDARFLLLCTYCSTYCKRECCQLYIY